MFHMLNILMFALVCMVHAKVHFEETFDVPFDKRWVQSKSKDDYGKFTMAAGSSYGDKAINTGIQTSEDARFYAISTKIQQPFTNKNMKLFLSFTVKHDQGIDCGGGYLKVLPDLSLESFNGDSEYFIMFGPDICGHTKKIHLIFGYNGKNLLWKKEPRCEDDKLTHLYTLILNPDNSYEVQVDSERRESGKLEEDWEFLLPKELDDPKDKKPADWVEDPEMDDPEDKKPADWDNEPETTPDPNGKQPDDWDESEDGQWEAPQIPNPKFKGEWKPKRIPNPKYKGVFKPKQIPNPEYKADDEMYLARKPLAAVGFDLWQVKAGTIFDNIFISNDESELKAFVDKTWSATKNKEKEMHEAASKKDDEKKDDEKESKDDEEVKEDL